MAERTHRLEEGIPLIVVIAGTNRPDSNTSRVARAAEALLAAEGAEVERLELIDLPAELFDPNCYGKKPESFAPFQDAITRATGVLSVVPEYNGSFPGIMKYFIDMLKFPESLKGVPAAFIGLGSGEWGGLRGVEQLEMVFQYRSAHLFGRRVFLKHIQKLLGEDGSIADESARERLQTQAREFVAFCAAAQNLTPRD